MIVMTPEERQLLLKDLSARLPYNVVIRCTDSDTDYKCFLTTDILIELQNNTMYFDYKPYLRPMSSMTEEERKQYHEMLTKYDVSCFVSRLGGKVFDWLNINHFDYRGLIPMGLALEALAHMYKTE